MLGSFGHTPSPNFLTEYDAVTHAYTTPTPSVLAGKELRKKRGSVYSVSETKKIVLNSDIFI